MSDLQAHWKNKNVAAGISGTPIDELNMGIVHPSVNSLYDQFIVPLADHPSGFALKGTTWIKLLEPVEHGAIHHVYGTDQELAINDARTHLDTGETFEAGRDYCIYLCGPDEQGGASLVVSLNASFPVGHTADNSRKIGGFHTLCADAGSIANHPLSGLRAGEILPASFWDLTHRPTCSPAGMVYIKELDFWADIYLQSGSGAGTRSVFNGTITDSQTYSQHLEDLFRVGKTPLSDEEFQCAAEGSNQGTNIVGGVDPVTTGGHLDTAGRRMISRYGLEDCCGALWQWLSGWGYGSNQAGSYVADSGKGKVYQMNALLAGGAWPHSAICGSRARDAYNSRLHVLAYLGCRGRASSR